MRTFIFTAIIVLASLGLSGCEDKKPELRSPCVSADNGVAKNPCGPRTPVNTWMNDLPEQV